MRRWKTLLIIIILITASSTVALALNKTSSQKSLSIPGVGEVNTKADGSTEVIKVNLDSKADSNNSYNYINDIINVPGVGNVALNPDGTTTVVSQIIQVPGVGTVVIIQNGSTKVLQNK